MITAELKWSTATPTEEGFYWICVRRQLRVIRIWEVSGRMVTDIFWWTEGIECIAKRFGKLVKFYGPIVPPALPRGLEWRLRGKGR